MLEKLVKNIGRKITSVALAGSLLLSLGCATYKTISPNLIQVVTPMKRPIQRPIDYTKLTWQEAIEFVQTPEQAQDYLDRYFSFDEDDVGETFALNHADRRGTCIDYAISAAALLSDNNYPSLMLAMGSAFREGHAVFLYRTESGYGAIGTSPLDPKYRTVEELVRGYNLRYNDDFSSFFIADLNATYPNHGWINENARVIIRFNLHQSLIKINNN